MRNQVDLIGQLEWTNLLRDRKKQTRKQDTTNFVVCMDRRVTTMYLHSVSPLCMSTLYLHPVCPPFTPVGTNSMTQPLISDTPTGYQNYPPRVCPWVSAINLPPPPHELAENRRQNCFRRHLVCSHPPPPAAVLFKPCLYHEVLRGLPLPDFQEFVQILRWSAINRVFRIRFINTSIMMGLWAWRQQFDVHRRLIFLQYSFQAKFVSSLLEMSGAIPPVP